MVTYKEVFQLAQEKGYKMQSDLLEPESIDYKAADDEILIELTLIQKQLRDEHKIHVIIEPNVEQDDFYCKVLSINEEGVKIACDLFDFTYEEASLEGTFEALKLLP